MQEGNYCLAISLPHTIQHKADFALASVLIAGSLTHFFELANPMLAFLGGALGVGVMGIRFYRIIFRRDKEGE